MAQRLNERDLAFQDLDFEEGSGNPTPLSPEWDEEISGLLLSGPEHVVAGESLPLCGVANFTTARRDALPSRLWEQVVVVVTDIERNQVTAGPLDEPSPVPGEDLAPAEEPGDEFAVDIDPSAPDTGAPEGNVVALEGGGIVQYRNIDAAATLGLTLQPGRYAVFLTYGAYKSNTVVVEAVEA